MGVSYCTYWHQKQTGSRLSCTVVSQHFATKPHQLKTSKCLSSVPQDGKGKLTEHQLYYAILHPVSFSFNIAVFLLMDVCTEPDIIYCWVKTSDLRGIYEVQFGLRAEVKREIGRLNSHFDRPVYHRSFYQFTDLEQKSLILQSHFIIECTPLV